MIIHVNPYQKKQYDQELNQPIIASKKPRFYHRSKEYLTIYFIDDSGAPVPVADTDTFEFAMDTNFTHGDDLMAYTSPVDIVITSAANGVISVPVNCNTAAFASKATAADTAVKIELKKYSIGSSYPVVMLQDAATANPLVMDTEGEPEPSAIGYYTATQVDALIRAGQEVRFSADAGATWHDTQTASDTHWSYRYPGGEWSPALALLRGQAGANGADGASVVWRGAWSAATTYAALDAVSLNGKSYIAKQASTDQSPDTATDYWDLIADKGADGAAGADGENGANGADGADGTNAPLTKIQYSTDASSWSDTYTTGDIYIRFSVDNGTTWSDSRRFRGADGVDGVDGVNGANGANGADGADAPLTKLQYSADASSWSDTYTSGDTYIRFSVDNGVTWTDARRLKGEVVEGAYVSISYTADDSTGLVWTGVVLRVTHSLGTTDLLYQVAGSDGFGLSVPGKAVDANNCDFDFAPVGGKTSGTIKIMGRVVGSGSGSAGMSNPMSAAGDLIVGGTDGAAGRLAKGADGQVLKLVSGAPAWADSSGGAGLGVYRSQFFSAANFVPRIDNGATYGQVETSTNKQNFDYLEFDAATAKYAQFLWLAPNEWDRGNVKVKLYWTTAATAGTGDVVWGVQGLALGDDDALDVAFGTAQEVTDSFIASGDCHVTAATGALTIGGSPAAGDMIQLQIYRKAADAADTYTQAARLLGVAIQWLETSTPPEVW